MDNEQVDGEPIEHVGERLALLDDDGRRVPTVEVTQVEVLPFSGIPWSFAAAEGEGDRDLDEWRAGHRRYWENLGSQVTDDMPVVCLRFVLASAVRPRSPLASDRRRAPRSASASPSGGGADRRAPLHGSGR